jgi:hypothetical protein
MMPSYTILSAAQLPRNVRMSDANIKTIVRTMHEQGGAIV